MTVHNLKLGKSPAVTRPGQPRLSGMKMMARVAPPRLVRSEDPGALMLMNQSLGDCTSAGLGNSIRALSALNGFETAITDQNAVAFYSGSTGYIPGEALTDRGGIEVDVLAYAAANGYPVANERLYPLWGSLDPADLNSLRVASVALGPVYIGIQLALADQANVGAVWDTDTPAEAGDPTPGSWGGHAVLAGWSYTGVSDTDIVTITTWGGLQKATWRWLRSRMDEAHGIIWPQLATPSSGFLTVADLDSVKAQNAAFLAGVNVA